MLDTKLDKSANEVEKLKRLKEEIEQELSKAIAKSRISKVLQNYGISNSDILKINFSLSPCKSQIDKKINNLVNTTSSERTTCNISSGNSFPCPVPLPNGSTVLCCTPMTCLQNGCALES